MVLLVRLQVLGEVLDARRDQRHLDLGRAGVLFVPAVLRDRRLFFSPLPTFIPRTPNFPCSCSLTLPLPVPYFPCFTFKEWYHFRLRIANRNFKGVPLPLLKAGVAWAIRLRQGCGGQVLAANHATGCAADKIVRATYGFREIRLLSASAPCSVLSLARRAVSCKMQRQTRSLSKGPSCRPNLTPSTIKAEKEFKAAKTIEEKIACMENMLALIPKHKGTDHMQADLKQQAGATAQGAGGGPRQGETRGAGIQD